MVPARKLFTSDSMSADEVQTAIHEQFRAYRTALQDDRRHLLEPFEMVDVARRAWASARGAPSSFCCWTGTARKTPCSCR